MEVNATSLPGEGGWENPPPSIPTPVSSTQRKYHFAFTSGNGDNYYEKHRDKLSDRFPALIRMALRLECELIAKCSSSRDMSALVMNGFDDAKASLSQDQKTFLAQNAVTKSNIVGLLQTGAHNYTGSYNLAQTIAMSLIVGGLLRLHCKRERGASNG